MYKQCTSAIRFSFVIYSSIRSFQYSGIADEQDSSRSGQHWHQTGSFRLASAQYDWGSTRHVPRQNSETALDVSQPEPTTVLNFEAGDTGDTTIMLRFEEQLVVHSRGQSVGTTLISRVLVKFAVK